MEERLDAQIVATLEDVVICLVGERGRQFVSDGSNGRQASFDYEIV